MKYFFQTGRGWTKEGGGGFFTFKLTFHKKEEYQNDLQFVSKHKLRAPFLPHFYWQGQVKLNDPGLPNLNSELLSIRPMIYVQTG